MNPVSIDEMLRQASAGHSVSQPLVCIKDLARGRFWPSRACDSERVAIRDFKKLAEEDPQISRNRQDFELYHVGIFDPITGKHHSIDPILWSRAVDFPTPSL